MPSKKKKKAKKDKKKSYKNKMMINRGPKKKNPKGRQKLN